MKRVERRQGRRRRVGMTSILVALIGGACGGATAGSPRVGSESHFLANCSGSCGGGLECIAGICTRPCLTAQSGCADLAPEAACTNQSVEPGRVAVCDLSCGDADRCTSLGNGYECRAGFCRQALVAGGGEGACQRVGRYEVGKEGGDLPCCEGLTEISTLNRVMDVTDMFVCDQLPLNTYACIEGTCGDGMCEEPERDCGCAADCADVPGPARDLICATYFDATPPPIDRYVSIVNAGTRTLYIEPVGFCSGNPTQLLSVWRGDEPVNVLGAGCGRTCQAVLESGARRPDGVSPEAWEADSSMACPIDCEAIALVPVAPGASVTQIATLEVALQRLPRDCAEGVVTDAISCYSRVIPEPGVYTLRVRAFTEPDCGPAGAASCEPLNFSQQGNYFFEDITFTLDETAD